MIIIDRRGHIAARNIIKKLGTKLREKIRDNFNLDIKNRELNLSEIQTLQPVLKQDYVSNLMSKRKVTH